MKTYIIPEYLVERDENVASAGYASTSALTTPQLHEETDTVCKDETALTVCDVTLPNPRHHEEEPN
jgi:hypothetical protein